MTKVEENKRLTLIRASLVFQLKLLADGFRDFVLLPISIGATLVGLLRSRDDPEREFEQVLDLGRQSERWINLFGTHEPHKGEGPNANLDQMVDRIEKMLQEQAGRGAVTENAADSLGRALDRLHEYGQRNSGRENTETDAEQIVTERD